MDYEPLDGSVVSIDTCTTLNNGFVADDLNVSSFEETVTLEIKPHSNGVDNEMSQFRPVLQINLPKHNSNVRVKKPGARIKLAFQKISKGILRHKQQWTFNHITPFLTT